MTAPTINLENLEQLISQPEEHFVDLTTLEVTEDAEKWTFKGLALPWETIYKRWGLETKFKKDCEILAPPKGIKAYFKHKDVIGKLTRTWNEKDGWWVEGFISKTSLGADVRQLMKDEVCEELSISYYGIEYTVDEESRVITLSKIYVNETSITDDAQYKETIITDVLEQRKENNMTQAPPVAPENGATLENNENGGSVQPDIPTSDQLNGFSEDQRRIISLEIQGAMDKLTLPAQPRIRKIDKLSAGAVLKAIVVHKDKQVIQELQEMWDQDYADAETGDQLAYTGVTSTSTVQNEGWVGDKTRLIDSAATLRNFFRKEALPKGTDVISYAELLTNTMNPRRSGTYPGGGAGYAQQAAEGDDLKYGKISMQKRTADVHTFGGYTQITRQTIELGSINYLDRALDAQAIALGMVLDYEMEDQFVALHTAQSANAVALPSNNITNWIRAVVRGAKKFKLQGLSLDGVICGDDVFEDLVALAASDGRGIVRTYGDGVNNIGEASPAGLAGVILGLPIIVDPTFTESGNDGLAAFANRNAIVQYANGVTRLQDENIINLSKDFSIYQYQALANEIPTGVVPITIGAEESSEESSSEESSSE